MALLETAAYSMAWLEAMKGLKSGPTIGPSSGRHTDTTLAEGLPEAAFAIYPFKRCHFQIYTRPHMCVGCNPSDPFQVRSLKLG